MKYIKVKRGSETLRAKVIRDEGGKEIRILLYGKGKGHQRETVTRREDIVEIIR